MSNYSNAFRTSDPTATLNIQYGEGFAAEEAITVRDLFDRTVRTHPNEKAMAMKRKNSEGVLSDWKFWTWKEYYLDCLKFAKSLKKLGLKKFDCVNILGFNSAEWFIAQNGSILGGIIAAGIYTTNKPSACHYVSEHSKAKVVVLEDNEQLEKYTQVGPLPNLICIVVYGEPIDTLTASKCRVPVYSWNDFLTQGNDVADAEVLATELLPGQCVSLIYTSGTTGPPKAVMISHDNITWVTKNLMFNYLDLTHKDRVVSYLPLSHIAAQMVDIYGMMVIGGCTYFCQPDALKGTLTITMKEVQPTFFFAVPRVWEKIQEKMMQLGRETTGILKVLSTKAKACGTAKSKNFQYGGSKSYPFGFGCANSVVLSKIKAALGLDKSRANFTSSAPISAETLWYFASLDIPIYEVFGQSECTGPHTVCNAEAWKVGSVGRPIKGTESKIDSVSGELCYRGRHIFMGYMYMNEKTLETIDDNGWLHSGDVAQFDEDVDPDVGLGFMTITGRIKELIITAGGENVPPVLIENQVKHFAPAVSNCIVIGDRKKFLSLLVSLKCEIDLEQGIPTEKLAKDALFVCEQIGSKATTYGEAKEDPKWKDYIDTAIKDANKQTTSNAQVIQKWKWLPEDFSEKEGDLTPTLKLKRSVVTSKYETLINSIYNE